MAEVALTYALDTIGNLTIQKVCFLLDVAEQVESLKNELEMLQSLLEVVAGKQDYDKRMLTWISHIRGVAQDAEDVIETFILKVATPRSSRGLIGKGLSFPIYLYHLHRVGVEIRFIQGQLHGVKNSLTQYKNETIDKEIGPATTSRNVDLLRHPSPGQKDKHLVGLDKDVETIKRAILDESKGRSIVSIVGMGGIGKSTLAWTVYNDVTVRNRFDCVAWVCVSRKFKPLEIIMELLRKVTRPNQEMIKVAGSSEDSQVIHLKNTLFEYLDGKQYFIVMDDVWQSEHWECLQSAFPDDEDKASRVLLTSRKQGIAVARYVHSMKPLAREDSWQLLLKKAFPRNNHGKCTERLASIGTKILEKCNDLPLAITTVGDLLSQGEQFNTTTVWENVLGEINHNFGKSIVPAVLELSYHNLSPELKSCFLCLGFFNEGAPINAKKLAQVWIAEGLISYKGRVETAEEIARRYLDELISHNMVQVMEMTIDDQVKKCCIQEFLLKLSITKANDEIGLEILKEETQKEGNSQSSTKPRHCAIYCSTERFLRSMNQKSRLRSLFFHGLGKVNGSPPNWKSFELLRVLDFEDFVLGELPGTIGALIGLRYLGLRSTGIRRLPRSLHRLKNLEVLDIALNFMVEVPNVIWKMDRLRHFYMSGISCKVPFKIDMENLRTLLYIPVAYWKPEQVTSLQKLGIELEQNSDVSELIKSLAKLQKLVCLKLKGSYSQGMASLDGLDTLSRLTKLKLHGRLTTLPSANEFPPSLSCLSLAYTYLVQDPMPILENLKNLRYLKMREAFDGHEMVISKDGFPMLKALSLHKFPELKNLEVGNDAMKELQRLEINSCPHLETLPEQVRFMRQLQELKMATTNEIASKLRGEYFCKISSNVSVNLVVY